MSRIKAKHDAAADGICHVEFMRSYDIALRTKAKQLAFDYIKHIFFIKFMIEDVVKRVSQYPAMDRAVGRQVLVAVRYPDVADARGPSSLPKASAISRQRFACSIQNLLILSSLLERVKPVAASGWKRMNH